MKTMKNEQAFIEMLMDDELREKLHREIAPCSWNEFLDKYKEEHRKKFHEEFQY